MADEILLLTIKDDNGNNLYNGGEVAKYLSLRKIRTNFPDNDTVLIKTKTAGGEQNVVHLTETGLRRLLINSRKPKSIELARIIGIDILNGKASTIESSTIANIQDAFNGETMILQYAVHHLYLIDLYFPEYKLAIECDEKHHEKQAARDKSREEYIIQTLNCTFIRYAPQEKDFNIFKIINLIHTHIRRHVAVTGP